MEIAKHPSHLTEHNLTIRQYNTSYKSKTIFY